MEESIYLLASELHDLLLNDPRLLRLNELEKKMENSEEVMALSYQKDNAIALYSDALNHFGENASETKKCQRELFNKKEALDQHPLVKEYLQAYIKVRDLYFQINDILFSDLSLHLKEKRNG